MIGIIYVVRIKSRYLVLENKSVVRFSDNKDFRILFL